MDWFASCKGSNLAGRRRLQTTQDKSQLVRKTIVISATYLQWLQQRHVIHESQRIEDVELRLVSDDQSILDEVLQTTFQSTGLLSLWFERNLSGVVVEIRGIQYGVLDVADDRRWEGKEREKICDLLGLGVLRNVSSFGKTFGWIEGDGDYLDNIYPKHLSFSPPICVGFASSLAA